MNDRKSKSGRGGMLNRRLPRTCACAAAVLATVTTHASVCAEAAPAEPMVDEAPVANVSALEEAVMFGKVDLNIRFRAEIADADGLQTSEAYTERVRLGYESEKYEGFTFYFQVEDIRTVDDDRYNAAGTSGRPDKTVIADPEDTELNQALVKYDWDEISSQIIFGRQKITLDDHRFVGNVGWRQNEQTFDAVTLVSTPAENVSLIYAYIWDINRVFGPDADLDLTSESHAINVSFDETPVGKVTVFGYLLDVDGQAFGPPLSSDTFGIRVSGKTDLDYEDLGLGYVFSYAHQVDAGDNTTDYNADYFFVKFKLTHDPCFAGVAYEYLGSDDGTASFQTPLATGHKFNGWADVFLTTPATGLQDVYGFIGTTFSCGVKGKIVYHRFFSDEGSVEFGDEIDVVMSKALSDNLTGRAKYARFDGNAGRADVNKFWLEAVFAF